MKTAAVKCALILLAALALALLFLLGLALVYQGLRAQKSYNESGFSAAPSFETITKTYENIPFISDHYPVAAVLVF